MHEKQSIYQTETVRSPDPVMEPASTGLFDVRLIVFLISVLVISMTVTVMVFSRGDNSKVDEVQPNSAGGTASMTDANKSADSVAIQVPADDVSIEPASRVDQSADGAFELQVNQVLLSAGGLKVESSPIAHWQTGDSAAWKLLVKDSAKRTFYCYVTYQAKLESQFSIQLGRVSPRKFTVYPQDEDFTEQFIVRIDNTEEQDLKLLALKVEPNACVQIKQIRLVPR